MVLLLFLELPHHTIIRLLFSFFPLWPTVAKLRWITWNPMFWSNTLDFYIDVMSLTFVFSYLLCFQTQGSSYSLLGFPQRQYNSLPLILSFYNGVDFSLTFSLTFVITFSVFIRCYNYDTDWKPPKYKCITRLKDVSQMSSVCNVKCRH